MGWLIALVIVVLIAILPVGASIIYDADGLVLRLLLGWIRIRLFPKKQKKTAVKQKQEQKAKPEKKSKTGQQSKKEPSGGRFLDFLPLVRIALEFLGSFRRKLRLDCMELKLTMAAEDPCDLAVNYGRAWAALGNLMPQLERLFVIKKRDLQIQCDFAGAEPVIYARLDVTITVGRLLGLVVKYGFKAVREFMNIMKLRKGGAYK